MAIRPASTDGLPIRPTNSRPGDRLHRRRYPSALGPIRFHNVYPCAQRPRSRRLRLEITPPATVPLAVGPFRPVVLYPILPSTPMPSSRRVGEPFTPRGQRGLIAV